MNSTTAKKNLNQLPSNCVIKPARGPIEQYFAEYRYSDLTAAQPLIDAGHELPIVNPPISYSGMEECLCETSKEIYCRFKEMIYPGGTPSIDKSIRKNFLNERCHSFRGTVLVSPDYDMFAYDPDDTPSGMLNPGPYDVVGELLESTACNVICLTSEPLALESIAEHLGCSDNYDRLEIGVVLNGNSSNLYGPDALVPSTINNIFHYDQMIRFGLPQRNFAYYNLSLADLVHTNGSLEEIVFYGSRLFDTLVVRPVEGGSEYSNRVAEYARGKGHETIGRHLDVLAEPDFYSQFVMHAFNYMQEIMRKNSTITKLRFLVIADSLTEEVLEELRRDPEGLVLLPDRGAGSFNYGMPAA